MTAGDEPSTAIIASFPFALVSDAAAKELSIPVSEGRFATRFLPDHQIVQKCHQHSFVVDERTGRGPTSLGSFDQREVVGVGKIRIVNARQGVEEFLKFMIFNSSAVRKRVYKRESFEEPVVIAFELQRVWHPEMKHLVSEDDSELADPVFEICGRID